MQVEECMSPIPQPTEMRWLTGSGNEFPRWPNDTSWPSAWDLQANNPGSVHVVSYNITAGWPTNLVTRWWPLTGQTNQNGQQLYEGEYWYQGAKLVHYEQLTVENDSFVVPGIPDGSQPASVAYSDDTSNERHYWSQFPTNTTSAYNTSFRVWGAFTTYVTHLSNHLDPITCYNSSTPCTDTQSATAHSGGRFEASNIIQCPFHFRCFSPEAAAGSPACHRRFPDDYLGTPTQQNARKCFVAPHCLYGAKAHSQELACYTSLTFSTSCCAPPQQLQTCAVVSSPAQVAVHVPCYSAGRMKTTDPPQHGAQRSS